MQPANTASTTSFRFPEEQARGLPDPSRYFSEHLRSPPYPTSPFFLNFVLRFGDRPEYIHPYIIRSASSSVQLCYPSRNVSAASIVQEFKNDLVIEASLYNQDNHGNNYIQSNHFISSFSDLCVTLDVPPSLRFFLARGSPFVTCITTATVTLSIKSFHSFEPPHSNGSSTKHTIRLKDSHTWICYSSSPLNLTLRDSVLTADNFSGVLRFAVLPNSEPHYVTILDRFSNCYAVSGRAFFTKPFCLEYKWEKKGRGELLLLAHPLHRKLLDVDDGDVAVLDEFKYNSIDGDLVGVVGNWWHLKTDPIKPQWKSFGGIEEKFFPEIASALRNDVGGLTPITTVSPYVYGKIIARAARLAVIAEEIGSKELIPAVSNFLRIWIGQWLDGKYTNNSFLYDTKWGGIISKGSEDESSTEFNNYRGHHHHLGYFLYAIAVLVRNDKDWGRKYRSQAYSILGDFLTLGRRPNSNYPRLRCFDPWILHSWSGEVAVYNDGRHQESSSEAVNAYYSAALMGMSYEDSHLVDIASTLASLEIRSAQTWWHVREGNAMYEEEFSRENRLMGVLWTNMRDTGLWQGPSRWKEYRVAIQVRPITPITEILFGDVRFVKEMVKWALPATEREDVSDRRKGFLYAMEGMYDKESAPKKIRSLKEFHESNSLSNMLWWIYISHPPPVNQIDQNLN
ncbi:PREDICTED: probable endo-1,3(4)-beta-glucanase ARB_01444 [Nelumbo nucifera]|uniref:glucan endo-1,3-beta-D-glucosidase n=2 Tax=Nelumbo nucifera TaxID=4432 RepID=A0A822ZP12_NELNU|nr:PREDICTED: probable endo-1,3(4)-beta-glucanase ARB_01444 [Nelumbo nucifera]DAD43528.1 TPA_asm: hypothetical protein HUJ06_001758 [Nelumbo nucifera]